MLLLRNRYRHGDSLQFPKLEIVGAERIQLRQALKGKKLRTLEVFLVSWDVQIKEQNWFTIA